MHLPGRARLVVAALAMTLSASCGPGPAPAMPPGASMSGGAGAVTAGGGPTPPASPVPAPGHELYGFVPYWEMDSTIAAHVAATPLSTVGLFSVTNDATGALSTGLAGYRRIAGPVGAALIAAAHRRGTRVEVVFSSLGAAHTRALLASASTQAATVRALVALVGRLGADGVDVDVEGLDPGQLAAYGTFVGQLRTVLLAADAHGSVTVATGSGPTGAAMAAAAIGAGADRAFLMGYDYRTAASSPGGTAPVARADQGRSLTWSLDLYAAWGIPPGRLLLGLPLYGMAWPVAGPVIGAPSTGSGSTWVPRQHLDVLANPAAVPQADPLEAVDVYFLGSDGSVAAPPAAATGSGSAPWEASGPAAPATPSPTPSAASGPVRWTAVYVDSPATLATKLGLGESRGLAGAGFWAIGYERGLPGYTDLMAQFGQGGVPAP